MTIVYRNFPGDWQSYTPAELPRIKPRTRREIWNIPSEWCTVSFLLSYPLHCKHGYGTCTERQRRVIGMMVGKAKAAGITTIFNIMDEVFYDFHIHHEDWEILNLIPTLMWYNIAILPVSPAKYKFADVKRPAWLLQTLGG